MGKHNAFTSKEKRDLHAAIAKFQHSLDGVVGRGVRSIVIVQFDEQANAGSESSEVIFASQVKNPLDLLQLAKSMEKTAYDIGLQAMRDTGLTPEELVEQLEREKQPEQLN
jgi:hypothetical protein